MAFERDPKQVFVHDRFLNAIMVRFFPSWVTPNQITVLRFFLAPVVVWYLYQENYAVGVPLFIFAALTDALDGTLARIRDRITPWGTFYDPVADKLLIGSVVLLFVMKHVHPWFAFTILALELAIVLGGYFRRKTGRLVTANVFGKTKMLLQVIGVAGLLIAVWAGIGFLFPLSVFFLSVAILLAVVSLFTYGI